MSQQKKPEDIITNIKIYNRLCRLGWHKAKPEFITAYLGLIICNQGKAISLSKATKIIKNSKLDLKLVKANNIPFVNIVETLIFLLIYKRPLFEIIFSDRTLPIWQDEIAAPLLDIMYDISRIYKV